MNISYTVRNQNIVIKYILSAPNLILKLKLKPVVFFIILKETSISNSGSKSTILERKSIVVKEQRVDDS